MESSKAEDTQNPVDPFPELEISSMTTRSRHSSIALPDPNRRDTDPYGRGSNCFPICNAVSSAYGGVESYARSLMFAGHGFAIYDSVQYLNRSARFSERGNVCIGDVGILDPGGDFVFAFNLFADPEDTLHADDIPPDFEQYPQPEPPEHTLTEDHFPPGTVIASKGVRITHSQEPTLQFRASTNAREAGILVLPEGASREEWKVDTALFQYLERHALDWYQHLTHNIKASVATVPNGAVYLVTGVDKAYSATSVAIPGSAKNAGRQLDMRYDSTDADNPWSGAASTNIAHRQSDAAPFAVFLRGIRISLSNKKWILHLDDIPKKETPYYNLLSTPITGFMSRLVRRKEMWFGVPSSALDGRQEVLFHISDILAQAILDEVPEAEYALVDDSAWTRQLTPSSDGTKAEVAKLVTRILTFYEAKLTGKVVMLQPRSQDTAQPRGLLDRILGGSRSQQQLQARISRVMSRR